MKNSFFLKTIILIATLLLLNFEAVSQKKSVTAADPILVSGKPSVYISFERIGKRKALRDDETGEGIWLKIHNNIKYSIKFCTFGVSEEGEQLIISKNNQIGVYYDVIFNSISSAKNPPLISSGENSSQDIPIGYPTNGICQEFELGTGKSFLFSVPKHHLTRGLSIKISFSYEWEEIGEDNPTHFVYFNSLSIPK